jgi:hypothetical protein
MQAGIQSRPFNCGRGAAATPGSLDEMMLLNPFCKVLSGSAISADIGSRTGNEL